MSGGDWKEMLVAVQKGDIDLVKYYGMEDINCDIDRDHILENVVYTLKQKSESESESESESKSQSDDWLLNNALWIVIYNIFKPYFVKILLLFTKLLSEILFRLWILGECAII